MNEIIRFTLVLFIVSLIAASILSGVYFITKPRIEAQERLIEERALEAVMPETIGERLEPVKDKGRIKYWKVFKGSSNKVRGYVFIARKYAYSSNIETMVGMKSNGTITGVRILSQNETPGLGAKVVEVVSNRTILKALKDIFSKEKRTEQKILPFFTEQFKGWNIKEVELSKNGIQAITGATISSTAVLESIKSKGLEMLNVE